MCEALEEKYSRQGKQQIKGPEVEVSLCIWGRQREPVGESGESWPVDSGFTPTLASPRPMNRLWLN